MPTATFLSESAVNRISNRLATVRPELRSTDAPESTMLWCLPPTCWLVNPHVAEVPAYVAEACECWQETGAIPLATQHAEPIEIWFEVEGPGFLGDLSTTRPMFAKDEIEMFLHLTSPTPTCEEYEWEDYGEPLWNSVKSEVRLLVQEYVEEADADSA